MAKRKRKTKKHENKKIKLNDDEIVIVEEKEIDRVQFCIPSREEVRNIAVVEVSNASTVVSIGINNTLHDSRMGAFKNVKCCTCKGESDNCDGHFGLIKLTRPVLNPLYQNITLKHLISTYCFSCYKTLKECACIQETTSSKKRKKKNPKIIKSSKSEHYQRLKLNYSINGKPLTISELYTYISKLNYKHSPSHIDATDCCFIHDILVLPICCRSPNFANGAWSTSPISRLYGDIINKNNFLRMRENVVVDVIKDDLHNELQDVVNILFDINNTNRKLQTNVITNGSMRQRIDSKQGRIRLNLQGKRCEFSARTVLSGDPNLSLNEIGIPKLVANSLTIPVRVTEFNLHLFWKKYTPKYVLKPNGDRYDCNYSNTLIELGDIVDRCLINGDIVAVNRQPTLHRGSVIACKVRIFPSLTFRLNYSSMITLNGDCDGDELNLFVPQDLESRAELQELMLTTTNIVSSQSCQPLIGLTQDSLLGVYQISKDINISRNDCMDFLYKANVNAENTINLTKQNYTGIQVLSFVLKCLNISFRELNLENCKILGSEIQESSVFNKAVVGVSNRSLIHHVFLKYDHIRAGKLIWALQKIATAYLDTNGFSVGISDFIVKDEVLKKPNVDAVNKIIKEEKGNVNEDELVDALSKITKMKPDVRVDQYNALLEMIYSGSKGSIANFNQITRCVGQQIINGKRVECDMSNNTRSTPHFTKYDQSLEANGFIKSSYIKGLNPCEFFAHARCGRIGIIDTSVKTSVTGSTQRRLIKTLESAIIHYGPNNTRVVKDPNTGAILSFNYGDDGLDATYIMK